MVRPVGHVAVWGCLNGIRPSLTLLTGYLTIWSLHAVFIVIRTCCVFCNDSVSAKHLIVKCKIIKLLKV